MEQNIMRFGASLVESVGNIANTIIKEFSKQVKKLLLEKLICITDTIKKIEYTKLI